MRAKAKSSSTPYPIWVKLLDTIKSYELEQRRIALEEKRYALMKQKISGEYDVDPDTGEIDDSYTEDSEDGEV